MARADSAERLQDGRGRHLTLASGMLSRHILRLERIEMRYTKRRREALNARTCAKAQDSRTCPVLLIYSTLISAIAAYQTVEATQLSSYHDIDFTGSRCRIEENSRIPIPLTTLKLPPSALHPALGVRPPLYM